MIKKENENYLHIRSIEAIDVRALIYYRTKKNIISFILSILQFLDNSTHAQMTTNKQKTSNDHMAISPTNSADEVSLILEVFQISAYLLR
jgi:hypothetical protein